jgi:hypothetical protein
LRSSRPQRLLTFGFLLYNKNKVVIIWSYDLFLCILYLVNRLDMGYPTKVQLIKRAKSEQWYVNFPAAVAQAIEFQQGEVVEWIIDDHQRLILQRSDQSVADLKKKLPKKT